MVTLISDEIENATAVQGAGAIRVLFAQGAIRYSTGLDDYSPETPKVR
jgi:hypothetical protein